MMSTVSFISKRLASTVKFGANRGKVENVMKL